MNMTITFGGNKTVLAHYKNFTVITDQPARSGGNDSAPSPFDLFLTSIGTCVGYYVLTFCQQRSIPTDQIQITQKMHADAVKHLIGTIEIDISLPSDFPGKYLDALIKAASQCTVKKHLQDPPKFEISTSIQAFVEA